MTITNNSPETCFGSNQVESEIILLIPPGLRLLSVGICFKASCRSERVKKEYDHVMMANFHLTLFMSQFYLIDAISRGKERLYSLFIKSWPPHRQDKKSAIIFVWTPISEEFVVIALCQADTVS